ncbi:MAG: agmatinase [Flavobacterium sp.]|nr:agmatinase [Pedobacter sp.]
MISLSAEHNFLGIQDEALCNYQDSKVVIQAIPYEHTSSYLAGSAKGPDAIIKASQFVEFYDEELDVETLNHVGICTIAPLDFSGKVDAAAVQFIDEQTTKLINDGKFVVSLGAEHTVTLGFVKAHLKKYKDLTVLQIDAHSDLRESYQGNNYSHASVMARVHEMGINICQAGIRALCIEEADLIKNSVNIHTAYAHQIRLNPNWIKELILSMTDNVYITIDADGFDPSIMPAVGTAEPNGLFWNEILDLLRTVCKERNVIGFDIVECAPIEGSILSEYTLAKLAYRLLGYVFIKQIKD